MSAGELERLAALEAQVAQVREDIAAIRASLERLTRLAHRTWGFWLAVRVGAAFLGLAATVYEALKIGRAN